MGRYERLTVYLPTVIVRTDRHATTSFVHHWHQSWSGKTMASCSTYCYGHKNTPMDMNLFLKKHSRTSMRRKIPSRWSHKSSLSERDNTTLLRAATNKCLSTASYVGQHAFFSLANDICVYSVRPRALSLRVRRREKYTHQAEKV